MLLCVCKSTEYLEHSKGPRKGFEYGTNFNYTLITERCARLFCHEISNRLV